MTETNVFAGLFAAYAIPMSPEQQVESAKNVAEYDALPNVAKLVWSHHADLRKRARECRREAKDRRERAQYDRDMHTRRLRECWNDETFVTRSWAYKVTAAREESIAVVFEESALAYDQLADECAKEAESLGYPVPLRHL